MLDYHLHLWEHGSRPLEATVEQVAAYCRQAAARGVTEVAITEHLHRFRQADAVLGRWWEDDPDPARRRAAAAYRDEELGADLDRYVEVLLAARAAGLPVVIGLEIDHPPGRAAAVADLLRGYPFDVLLGSVHWIGAWGFDNYEHPTFAREWDARAVEDVWEAYTRALEELAASGACDVLAHPDLCKVVGRRPDVTDEFHARIAEAAAAAGLVVEASSAGWRKPVGEAYPASDLLRRCHAAGVGVTAASDAHVVERVAERHHDLAALLLAAGYRELTAFERRVPRPVPLSPPVPA